MASDFLRTYRSDIVIFGICVALIIVGLVMLQQDVPLGICYILLGLLWGVVSIFFAKIYKKE